MGFIDVVVMAAADFKERMARYSRTVTLCVVTRDESSGEVSVEGDGTPVITYSMNAADEATALEGIETGLRVLIAAGATEVGTHQQDGERFSLKGAQIANPTPLVCKQILSSRSIPWPTLPNVSLILHDCFPHSTRFLLSFYTIASLIGNLQDCLSHSTRLLASLIPHDCCGCRSKRY